MIAWELPKLIPTCFAISDTLICRSRSIMFRTARMFSSEMLVWGWRSCFRFGTLFRPFLNSWCHQARLLDSVLFPNCAVNRRKMWTPSRARNFIFMRCAIEGCTFCSDVWTILTYWLKVRNDRLSPLLMNPPKYTINAGPVVPTLDPQKKKSRLNFIHLIY